MVVLQSDLLVQILKATVDTFKLTLGTSNTLVHFNVTSQYMHSTLKWALHLYVFTLPFHLFQAKMGVKFPQSPNPPATTFFVGHGTEQLQTLYLIPLLAILLDREIFFSAFWAGPFHFLDAVDAFIAEVIFTAAGGAGISH